MVLVLVFTGTVMKQREEEDIPIRDVLKDASCISCHSQASYFLL